MSDFNPLDYRVSFTYPLRVEPSAWAEHVPFGMFLIDILRPRVVVELGTYRGVSYCAFCQAVKELGIDTRCYAIDTWEGDTQGGFFGPEVLAELKGHHDPLYGSFSRLVQSTFDEALRYFTNGTIDLLHIDGFHTHEAVKRDFESWLPKMSNRGVVLFHDINVRERDFGVWKLWDELKPQYPHFEIIHGHGLGVLAVGQQYPEILRRLLEASEEEVVGIREFFYQLGLRVEAAQEVQHLKQVVKDQSATIGHLEGRLQTLRESERRLQQSWIVRLLQAWSNQGILGVMRKGWAKLQQRLVPQSKPVKTVFPERVAEEPVGTHLSNI